MTTWRLGSQLTLVSGVLLLLAACAQQREGEGEQSGMPAYRYDAPPRELSAGEAVPQETSPLIHDPRGTGRQPAGSDEDAYDAAAEQCHNYARAVVLQDRRISHDRDTGRGGEYSISRTFSLQRSMQQFGEQGSYERHFSRCMESRGVVRRE